MLNGNVFPDPGPIEALPPMQSRHPGRACGRANPLGMDLNGIELASLASYNVACGRRTVGNRHLARLFVSLAHHFSERLSPDFSRSSSMKATKLMCIAAVLASGIAFGPTAQAQQTLVILDSIPGDSIGQGQTQINLDPSQIAVSGDLFLVTISVFGYKMSFSAPEALAVGTYDNWFNISGNGRSCVYGFCGSFQILEIGTNAAGEISRLWLTFSEICNCIQAPLVGEVRYNSESAPTTSMPRTLRVPLDYSTIQEAASAASFLTNDTILVYPGIYKESVVFHGKSAYLVSASGPSITTIVPAPGAAGIVFNGPRGSDSVVRGFTITNGAGGISISQASPLIVSNIIVDCDTGIYCYESSATIRQNLITGCSGAGIHFNFRTDALAEGNVVQSNGVGFDAFGDGTSTIKNNLIQGNGLDGIRLFNGYSPNILQNIIVANLRHGISASVSGGSRGPFIIINTIVGNGLPAGSGIDIDGFPGASQIVNNIVVGSPAVRISSWYDEPLPLAEFNDFYSPFGEVYAGKVSDLTGMAGNISADPRFACLPSGDYHLLSASSCLDAGTNDTSILSPEDYDGNSRVVASSSGAPERVDMGAFEFGPSGSVAPCLYLVCPPNVVSNAAPRQTSLTVSFPGPWASFGARVQCSPPSGSLFTEGTNIVSCLGTDGTNVATCSFEVIVLVPPTIVSQPRRREVHAGQKFTLSVRAVGSGPLTYQWLFQGNPIPDANGPTLTVSGAQKANEGYYQVAVTNVAGSATSAQILLRVLKPIRWHRR